MGNEARFEVWIVRSSKPTLIEIRHSIGAQKIKHTYGGWTGANTQQYRCLALNAARHEIEMKGATRWRGECSALAFSAPALSVESDQFFQHRGRLRHCRRHLHFQLGRFFVTAHGSTYLRTRIRTDALQDITTHCANRREIHNKTRALFDVCSPVGKGRKERPQVLLIDSRRNELVNSACADLVG